MVKLARTGSAALTVWECQLTDRDRLAARIAAFLMRGLQLGRRKYYPPPEYSPRPAVL